MRARVAHDTTLFARAFTGKEWECARVSLSQIPYCAMVGAEVRSVCFVYCRELIQFVLLLSWECFNITVFRCC